MFSLSSHSRLSHARLHPPVQLPLIPVVTLKTVFLSTDKDMTVYILFPHTPPSTGLGTVVIVVAILIIQKGENVKERKEKERVN